jgi:tRNA(Arg) A34 adenosine deaminase TadA
MIFQSATNEARQDFAILRDGDTVYRASSPLKCVSIESAPVVLIQGIYDLKPEQARRIVRHRIFTTGGPSPSLSGIVKVAAKRITPSLTEQDEVFQIRSGEKLVEIHARDIHRPPPPDLSGLLQNSSEWSNSQWMSLAKTLAHQIHRQEARYASDRPIAALLVSAENTLLGAAVNTNAKNRTLHAEMNLIASLSSRRIPPGSRLFTTLKPCRMCAGMICDSSSELRALQVIFSEDDPGPHARNTALDQCEFPVQSRLFPED